MSRQLLEERFVKVVKTQYGPSEQVWALCGPVQQLYPSARRPT